MPLQKTPCTPVGRRMVRRPPPGRSATRSAGLDAHRRRIEQQQVGLGAERDAAAIPDAVEIGGMAGQAADAFDDVEVAALAHPMAEEMQAKARIAHIDEMCAGIGQRHHAGLVLQQARHAVVADIEEAAEEGGLEVLVEAEIEHDVERIAALGRGDLVRRSGSRTWRWRASAPPPPSRGPSCPGRSCRGAGSSRSRGTWRATTDRDRRPSSCSGAKALIGSKAEWL